MSERLRLREFRDSDLDVLAAMVGDEEQMTRISLPGPADRCASAGEALRQLV